MHSSSIEDWGSSVVDGYSAILQNDVQIKKSNGTITTGWYYQLGLGVGSYNNHKERKQRTDSQRKHGAVGDGTYQSSSLAAAATTTASTTSASALSLSSKRERKKAMVSHNTASTVDDGVSRSGFTGRSGKGAMRHNKAMTSNLTGRTVNGPTSFVLSVSSKSSTEKRSGFYVQNSTFVQELSTTPGTAPGTASAASKKRYHYGFLSRQVAIAEIQRKEELNLNGREEKIEGMLFDKNRKSKNNHTTKRKLRKKNSKKIDARR